jgi:hypothetical protein
MNWRLGNRLIALVLAANYFAFQVELFDDEYEANHPRFSETRSITGPVFTWESFDKENAPRAFTVDPFIEIRPLFLTIAEPASPVPPAPPRVPARDKSPPLMPPHPVEIVL